jgi:hypothetical protein
VPRTRSHPLRSTALLTVAALIVAFGAYLAYHHASVTTEGCESDGDGRVVMLDTDQAAIASTIAGVATARKLPRAAVTIAYATAWQESHLHDLRYGTLDSVGVFQQRPSEGWGTPRELINPIYAAGKFFAALVKVPNYLHLPVYEAAQDVQHSADGFAYTNYQEQATLMSGPFTGGTPHAVWCWYVNDPPSAAQVATMRKALAGTFGRLSVRQADGLPVVRVKRPAAGWAVASWLVTHATAYGISTVRYAGYQWNASTGSRGWTRDPSAPSGTVELR